MSNLIIGSKGYIGSVLHPLIGGDSMDLLEGLDYDDFSVKFFKNYKNIILLAGHPSVASCERDPVDSFDNNVTKFFRLVQKLKYIKEHERQDQKFIFASSASVYGGANTGDIINGFGKDWGYDETSPFYPPLKNYDMHKQMIDQIASLSGLNYYTLRFATVCGYSPNPRLDVIINSMYCDTVNFGEIRVNNPHSNRSILGIGDLCRGVKTIIEKEEATPGVYNMASTYGWIQKIAFDVSYCLGDPPIIYLPDTETYNFLLETRKFEKEFSFKFQDNIESIVKDLKDNLTVFDKSRYTRA